MKNEWFVKFIIIAVVFTILPSFLFILTSKVSAQVFNCIVRKDVEIPYPFEYFKTKILANANFEIKFTIRDNSDNKLYVKLIPGSHDPAVTVDDKILTYYLGSDSYSSTKSSYDVIGSSEDDVEIPGISQLFSQASESSEDWVYVYDEGDAITYITISSDQLRIKYLEFWDDEFHDANMHADSQDFENFDDLEDADWENLTPNTGAPTILDNEEALYLTLNISQSYSSSAYPSYYYGFYPGNYSNVYYGNFPSTYPSYYSSSFPRSYQSGPLASYRGNFPVGFSGAYPSIYSSAYSWTPQVGFFGSYYTGYYSGGYPFGYSGAFYSGYGFPWGLGSITPIYGFGIPRFGGFPF
jgi:hypothetical protein